MWLPMDNECLDTYVVPRQIYFLCWFHRCARVWRRLNMYVLLNMIIIMGENHGISRCEYAGQNRSAYHWKWYFYLQYFKGIVMRDLTSMLDHIALKSPVPSTSNNHPKKLACSLLWHKSHWTHLWHVPKSYVSGFLYNQSPLRSSELIGLRNGFREHISRSDTW